uniref:Isoprenyl transferase n=1 Tax=uncultured Spirochaetales bacterium HF0500_06B09 TaxID=710994 RepID=E0XY96_9SPIR|nr:undecaprenyl pyrophosphate synthase [uncultured Spirochaetales bacterium HF0500_06B09]
MSVSQRADSSSDDGIESTSGRNEVNGVDGSDSKKGAMHVGIIMDGNGRWARARGLSRYDGYRAGTDAVRRAVECSADLGIGALTLYAFSSDNWRRPYGEVQLLLSLFRWYLQRETANCVDQGVRVSFIGRRDRFPATLQREIERSESATDSCDQLLLRIAADYSARDEILATAAMLSSDHPPTRSDFGRKLTGGVGNLSEVDLIVRTGGEQRLSDFLLWEAAYAELVFIKTLWPDFTRIDLERSLNEFRKRERRFGGIGKCSQQKGRTDVEQQSTPPTRQGRVAHNRAVRGDVAVHEHESIVPTSPL